MKGKSDFVFLGLLAALLLASFIVTLFTNFILVTSNYVALFFLQASVICPFFQPRLGRYLLGITLLLANINLINFFYIRYSVNGLDPITAVISIAFYSVNKKEINNLIFRLIRGSEKEQQENYQSKYNFYLNKFSSMCETEFAETMTYYNSHPPEAQAALQKLKAEAVALNIDENK